MLERSKGYHHTMEAPSRLQCQPYIESLSYKCIHKPSEGYSIFFCTARHQASTWYEQAYNSSVCLTLNQKDHFQTFIMSSSVVLCCYCRCLNLLSWHQCQPSNNYNPSSYLSLFWFLEEMTAGIHTVKHVTKFSIVYQSYFFQRNFIIVPICFSLNDTSWSLMFTVATGLWLFIHWLIGVMISI